MNFNLDETARHECSMHFIDKPGEMTHVRMKVDGFWLDSEEGDEYLGEIMAKNVKGTQGLQMMMALALMMGSDPNAEVNNGPYPKE